MALSHTPIAPDPGYERTSGFHPRAYVSELVTRGRTRPEATDIAERHQKGSLAHLFTSDPLLHTPPSHFKHTAPKNHYKENFKRIKQIQAKSKKKQVEAERPVTVAHKSVKYDTVRPKVFMQPSRPSTTPLDANVSNHSEYRPQACVKQTPVMPHEQGSHVHCTKVKSTKNFLAMNVESAARTQVKKPPSQQHLAALADKRDKELSSYKRGVLPQYLQERREQWRIAEEERISSLPDPSIPHGHTMMPDKERRNTLRVLEENLSILSAELQALPLHSVTLRVQKKKAELEVKLSEIEDAIKIFSKPKVFIKVDD